MPPPCGGSLFRIRLESLGWLKWLFLFFFIFGFMGYQTMNEPCNLLNTSSKHFLDPVVNPVHSNLGSSSSTIPGLLWGGFCGEAQSLGRKPKTDRGGVKSCFLFCYREAQLRRNSFASGNMKLSEKYFMCIATLARRQCDDLNTLS